MISIIMVIDEKVKNMTVGEKIKALRLEKGLSQKALGELCNPKLGASHIGRIENGTAPTTKTLNRIAAALGVPASELLDISEYLKPIETPIAYVNSMKDSLTEYMGEKCGYVTLKVGDNLEYWNFFNKTDNFNISSGLLYEFWNRLEEHARIEFVALLEAYRHNDK